MTARMRFCVALAAACAFPFHAQADHASVSLGNSGPGGTISTQSGATLTAGRWAVGLRSEYTEFDDFSDGQLVDFAENFPDEDIHSVDSVYSTELSLAFGVSDDFTLGFSLPYVKRSNIREAHHGEEGVEGEEEELEAENIGDADGLGDARFYGQYRFFRSSDNNTHLAAIAGLKLPTGRSHEISAEDERFEQEFQPGSGSWDPFFGAAFTQYWQRLRLDASAIYQITTEGDQDTDLGDVFAFNAGFSYRVAGDHQGNTSSDALNFDVVLELNGEWRDEEEEEGITDPNSGGTLLFLSPGLRVSSKGWNANVAFGFPLVDDVNGRQVEPDWRLVGGMSFLF